MIESISQFNVSKKPFMLQDIKKPHVLHHTMQIKE